MIEIYTDGYRGPQGKCQIGVSIQDDVTGELYFIAKPIGKATSMVAELIAFMIGIEKAAELGHNNINLYVDAMSIVHWYKGTAQLRKPDMRRIWKIILEVIAETGIEIESVNYIPSKQNKRADALSKATGAAEFHKGNVPATLESLEYMSV
jgi:ribonuclease HI